MADDAFDFYPCLVDRAPASIYVNLRYLDGERPAGADTRLSIVFGLDAPGSHGIGNAGEAETLDEIEHGLIKGLSSHGVVYSRFDDYWTKRLNGFRRVSFAQAPALVASSGR